MIVWLVYARDGKLAERGEGEVCATEEEAWEWADKKIAEGVMKEANVMEYEIKYVWGDWSIVPK